MEGRERRVRREHRCGLCGDVGHRRNKCPEYVNHMENQHLNRIFLESLVHHNLTEEELNNAETRNRHINDAINSAYGTMEPMVRGAYVNVEPVRVNSNPLSLEELVKKHNIVVNIVDSQTLDLKSICDECDVCMVKAKEKKWLKFGCGHGMCTKCAKSYLHDKNTCHLCRTPIQTINTLVPI